MTTTHKPVVAKISVKLKPFSTPHFVFADSGGGSETSYPLSMIDVDVLDKMCEQFRDDVFAKAGKHQPPRAG